MNIGTLRGTASTAALLTTLLAFCSVPLAVAADGAQHGTSGAVASHGPPDRSESPPDPADLLYGEPMPMPASDRPPASLLEQLLSPTASDSGKPGFEPGSPGTGQTSDEEIPYDGELPAEIGTDDGAGVTPSEYGKANHPYTTARVDNGYKSKANNVSASFPYAAAGKLSFRIGSASYVCSGSLIKRGLVVTAAHCVTAYGGDWYNSWQFAPAQYKSATPFTVWGYQTAYVLQSSQDGNDACAQAGVICPNDVAVIVLKPKSYKGSLVYPGQFTGWLGYGWDGYGFTPNDLAQISQLGYPVSHDSGLIMQRTDSYGFVDAGLSNNTIWGSRQTGGSSGGPELVNLGINGSLSVPLGSEANSNIVVGVTSWQYTDTSIKQLGASPFTSGNIKLLVDTACSAYPAVCN